MRDDECQPDRGAREVAARRQVRGLRVVDCERRERLPRRTPPCMSDERATPRDCSVSRQPRRTLLVLTPRVSVGRARPPREQQQAEGKRDDVAVGRARAAPVGRGDRGLFEAERDSRRRVPASRRTRRRRPRAARRARTARPRPGRRRPTARRGSPPARPRRRRARTRFRRAASPATPRAPRRRSPARSPRVPART